MSEKRTKLIVTLGPMTRTEQALRNIKDKGADFVRINMSHSTLEDLAYFVGLAKKVGVPFIIDTEGSQVRTGELESDSIELEENDEVKIFAYPKIGSREEIALKPAHVLPLLEKGDLLYVDFNSAILRVVDTSTLSSGYITAEAVSAGKVGRNKAVVIDAGWPKLFNLPALSEKDYQSIELGLREGVGHIAASFIRSADFVEEVRKASKGKMKVISKIESTDALNNLEEIIKTSDYLYLDRGDLSKEVPIEKIPFLQKHIIRKAQDLGKGVFVATNFLESMIINKGPTRAEVNDVVNTILDGACGVVLSAETAVGRYPIRSVNTINRLIAEAEALKEGSAGLEQTHLIEPHGGKLVDRLLRGVPEFDIESLPRVSIDDETYMDLEQIAIGTFSPLEGFMGREELASVLENTRLPNGTIWPLPIVLNIPEEEAEKIEAGQTVGLRDQTGRIVALLHVSEKYSFDLDEFAEKLYGTLDREHPGVRRVKNYHPWFLAGKIDLIGRRPSEHKEYELTPRQTRRLFAERGWQKVVGFHTRNVIHRGHEFIQLNAMDKTFADGMFAHPVVGKKKPGDFHARYIIQSYERMMREFYPKDSVVLATFATYSRYAGPREALFTAICRQNFGCSHFIVGRDHTGVGTFYSPTASHEIFDKFPDLGIKVVKFDKVFYSKKRNSHVHEPEDVDHREEDKLHISGTEARKMFEKGIAPPAWFMRPEISQLILSAIKNKEEVFVKDQRERQGTVIWFTGLSGSGKSTIAKALERRLKNAGGKTSMLDGDAVRATAHKHLDLSREGVRENNRLIAELAVKKSGEADFVLVSVISPYAEDRESNRKIVGGNFIEVYVRCPLEVCEARDTKGLYKKARAGEIANLIGFHDASPYEEPQQPDVKIDSDVLSVEESAARIIEFLKSRALL